MRLIASLLLASAVLAFAQTDRGTITGTVTDSAGAVVANAPLELRGAETGVAVQAVTSATGNYTFAQVPVGTYEVTASAPGFRTTIRQNIRVQAAQTVGVDISLEVGAATESVTVTAESTLLKTESSDVATNIQTATLNLLPILPIGNGLSSSHGVRNPQAMSRLSPGTFFDPNLNIKINGAPSNTTSIRVDGQDATNGVVQFSQAQTQPSVEALEEISIQTSNFAAEYGQTGGGLFNYTSKSGANQVHGSLYENNVNEAYNAAQPFTHNKIVTRQNNFGISAGGPITIPKIYNGKDRTFWFFNFEAFKELGTINNQNPTVPTLAFRQGDFSQILGRGTISGSPVDSLGQRAIDGQIFDPLSETRDAQGRRLRTPFAGNQIPVTRFDPVAVNLLKLIPNPTNTGLTQNFNSPFPTDRFTRIPSVKADHTINSKSKLSFYWSTTETEVQFCTPLCGSDGLPGPITATRGTFIESFTYRVNYDYTVSPTMLLHLGGGFVRNDFKDTAPFTNFDVKGVLGLAGTPLGPNDGARFPVFRNITGGNSSGGLNNLGPAAGNVQAIEQKPTYNASLTWVRNNHSFKFGGEARTEGYIDRTFTNTSGDFSFNAAQTSNPFFNDAGVALGGGTTGHPLASLLLGRVNTGTIAPFTSLRGGRHYLSFFGQDTWKVNRKLTLDLGLRWDFNSYAQEQHRRVPFFSPTVANAAAGGHLGGAIFEGEGANRCNCDLSSNYKHGWGPRLGAAYQLDDKTVVRAGFGITYAPSTGGRFVNAPGATQSLDNPGFGDAAFILGQGVSNQGQPLNLTFPNIRPDLFPLPGTTTTAAGFGVQDPNAGRPARQIQWSVGVQREVMRDLVVEAAYVANRGNWWNTNALVDYNAIQPGILLSQYGLDITKASDRAILTSQVRSAAAGRFQNLLPYAGFPTTASVAQALRPFPQFSAITGSAPLGKTWYDSLQAKVTKRLSHGVDLSYAFTWSKELQLGADNNGGGGIVNDIFNRDNNKQLSSFSRPIYSVLAVNYTTPALNFNKWTAFTTKDWTLGTVLAYGSGQPIPIPVTGTSTSNLGTALLRGTRAQRVDGQPLFLQDLNCHCFDPAQTQVLNPAAFTDPTPGTFTPTATYLDNFRFQRRTQESMSLGRRFRLDHIREGVTLQVRMEFQNVFNRTQTPNPSVPAATTAITRVNGVNNAGFGVISTLPGGAVGGNRTGTLIGRIQF